MSLLKGIRSHYSLFGPHGLLLVSQARLVRRPIEVAVFVPAIKHPIHLRLRTADVTVLEQVFLAAEYDFELSRAPQVIVDAGANIGLASVLYANKYPGAKIIAVEPEFSNYSLLKKNVTPYPKVIPVQGALWKEDGELTLANPHDRHDGFQTFDPSGESMTGPCGRTRGITLDTLMKDYDVNFIDILKVDIEGSEKEVFEHPSPWIDRVGVIAIELHDRLRAGCCRSVYLATKDFEQECRRGETVVFLRREYVGRESLVASGRAILGKSEGARNRANLPFKIARTT